MNKKKRKAIAQAEFISEAIKEKPKTKTENKKDVDLVGLAKELAKRRSDKDAEKVDL